jgi:hypothetical protein
VECQSRGVTVNAKEAVVDRQSGLDLADLEFLEYEHLHRIASRPSPHCFTACLIYKGSHSHRLVLRGDPANFRASKNAFPFLGRTTFLI